MFYKVETVCPNCGKVEWHKHSDVVRTYIMCCGLNVTLTGREQYDIHGAMWIGTYKKYQKSKLNRYEYLVNCKPNLEECYV